MSNHQIPVAKSPRPPAINPVPAPTPAERSAALLQQAREAANQGLDEILAQAAALQAQVAELKRLETLPPGVREHLKQLEMQLIERAQGITVLRGRL